MIRVNLSFRWRISTFLFAWIWSTLLHIFASIGQVFFNDFQFQDCKLNFWRVLEHLKDFSIFSSRILGLFGIVWSMSIKWDSTLFNDMLWRSRRIYSFEYKSSRNKMIPLFVKPRIELKQGKCKWKIDAHLCIHDMFHWHLTKVLLYAKVICKALYSSTARLP